MLMVPARVLSQILHEGETRRGSDLEVYAPRA